MLFEINDICFEMRQPHDLSFLTPYGRVFRVFDQLVSGNLCFGVNGSYGTLFIKYAGAPTMKATIPPSEAVKTLAHAVAWYPEHPVLPRLLTHGPVGSGYAAVYEWVDGEPLRDENTLIVLPEARKLPLLEKLKMLEGIYSLHSDLSRKGFMAVDLSPRNILIDTRTPAVHVCDIDLYRPYPVQNPRSWMPGEADYLAPEEKEKGATIDQRTTVWKLGQLGFTLMSQTEFRKDVWTGPDLLLPVIQKAIDPNPEKRFESVDAFVNAWRMAVGELY